MSVRSSSSMVYESENTAYDTMISMICIYILREREIVRETEGDRYI